MFGKLKRFGLSVLLASTVFLTTACGSSGMDVYTTPTSDYTAVTSMDGVKFAVPSDFVHVSTTISEVTEGQDYAESTAYLLEDDPSKYMLFCMNTVVISAQKGTTFGFYDLDRSELEQGLEQGSVNGIIFNKQGKKFEYEASSDGNTLKLVAKVSAQVVITSNLYGDFHGELAVLYDGETEYSLFIGAPDEIEDTDNVISTVNMVAGSLSPYQAPEQSTPGSDYAVVVDNGSTASSTASSVSTTETTAGSTETTTESTVAETTEAAAESSTMTTESTEEATTEAAAEVTTESAEETSSEKSTEASAETSSESSTEEVSVSSTEDTDTENDAASESSSAVTTASESGDSAGTESSTASSSADAEPVSQPSDTSKEKSDLITGEFPGNKIKDSSAEAPLAIGDAGTISAKAISGQGYVELAVQLLDVATGDKVDQEIAAYAAANEARQLKAKAPVGTYWVKAIYRIDTGSLDGGEIPYIQINLKGTDGNVLKQAGVSYSERTYDMGGKPDGTYSCYFAVPYNCDSCMLVFGDGTAVNGYKAAYYSISLSGLTSGSSV